MTVPATLEPYSGNRRSEPRRSLRLGFAIGGSGEEAIIHDLSLNGLLIESATELVSGEDLLVEIPECGPVLATVVWSSGRFFGCKFGAPIPAAALSAARLRDSSNFTHNLESGRNVYVVDEDDARRRSLVDFNQARGMEPRPFVSAEDFLKEVQGLKPGCVILGTLPQAVATDVVQAIGDNQTPVPIIMMAVAGSVASAVKAMKRPASEVLELPFQQSTAFELLNWLFADLERDLPLTHEIIEAEKLARSLTVRECQILLGLVGGMSNKEIAAELGLNVRTVEMHRSNMMRRLNAHTLSAALRIAFYAKVVPLPLEADLPRTVIVVPLSRPSTS